MSQKVIAVYENGVLRPLAPLNIPEHTQVEFELEAEAVGAPDARAAHSQAVRAALRHAGLSASPLPRPDGLPGRPSVEKRDELARLFSSQRPLAELISEDREER